VLLYYFNKAHDWIHPIDLFIPEINYHCFNFRPIWSGLSNDLYLFDIPSSRKTLRQNWDQAPSMFLSAVIAASITFIPTTPETISTIVGYRLWVFSACHAPFPVFFGDSILIITTGASAVIWTWISWSHFIARGYRLVERERMSTETGWRNI